MNSIIEAIYENGELFPEKVAISYENNKITYFEFCKKIQLFASSLRAKGVKKGSRIAIEADDLIAFFAALLGCHLAGCVAVPIEKDISIYRLQEILKTTKPTLVFMKNNGESFEEFFAPTDEKVNYKKIKSDSVCTITSTTGTTGNPVLVAHTNQNVLVTEQNLVEATNINAETIMFTNISFSLAAGYRRVLATLYAGATAVVSHRQLSEELLKEVFSNHNINYMAIVNSDLNWLVSLKDEFIVKAIKNLNTVQTVVGPLTSVSIRTFHKRFVDVDLYNVYGTTESGCIAVNKTSVNAEENCLGKPTVNSNVFVIDENGKKVTKPGEYGYMAVKGDMNMQGYYHKKALTEKVMPADYIVINDIVYFDEDGYYYFVSRVGDIIDVCGHKVLPSEIETVAMKFTGVVDCACVAKETELGSTPLLYVQIENKDGFCIEDLQKHLKKRLEKYKVPSDVVIIDKIPRTTTGKLMRKSLAMK